MKEWLNGWVTRGLGGGVHEKLDDGKKCWIFLSPELSLQLYEAHLDGADVAYCIRPSNFSLASMGRNATSVVVISYRASLSEFMVFKTKDLALTDLLVQQGRGFRHPHTLIQWWPLAYLGGWCMEPTVCIYGVLNEMPLRWSATDWDVNIVGPLHLWTKSYLSWQGKGWHSYAASHESVFLEQTEFDFVYSQGCPAI